MSQPNQEQKADRPDETTREQRRDTGVSTRSIRVRAERYLVAPLPWQTPAPAGEPAGAQQLIDRLTDDPEIRVVRVIQPASPGGGRSTPVAVVEMAPDHAALIAASPEFYVETDQPLRYGTAALPYTDPGVTPLPDGVTLTVQVENPDGEPLEGAAVHVLAEYCPTRAVTGADGRATVTVAAHDVDSIAGIYVRPRHDHWSAWLGRPKLTTTEPNPVVCARVDPAAVQGWSRRAIGFDRLPPTFRGHGVKIAIVDSGVATTREDLADRVVSGRDVVTQDEKSWQEDVVGFGTHAAGLIAATEERSGIVGLAPEVELHVCKIFPGGRFGDLVEALDYCIAQGVDVITIGVGSPYPSRLVASKIEEARQAGIACVAAAGSNAGPVAFPASLPIVLAVAAIGKLGTFPPDSYHATQLSGTPTPDGYFPARFSAYGPEIDLCAPGVGVVSTLPPSNVGALDGTAIAAPHVAALAALVLAHHPEFRNGYRVRGAARVDRLFEILRASCRPLPFSDRLRVGAGLPDAVVAVGLAPGPGYPAHPTLGALWSAMTHAGLIPSGVALPSFSGVPGPATASATRYPYDIGPIGLGPTATGPGGATRGLAELRAAMHSAGLTPETTLTEEPSTQ